MLSTPPTVLRSPKEARDGTTPRCPFFEETARQKVLAAEDAGNTRNPERIVLADTEVSPAADRRTRRAEERALLRSVHRAGAPGAIRGNE
ncbi:DUF1348 family protein [Amycolatopsis arida]|uniref:DUF1348 family protein n=1 Tax=Amycolatopsis arida TaxID=587909 RepID=UPI003CC81F50